MANDPNPNPFGGFQLPGLQMPAFSQTSLADNPVMNTLTGSMDFMKNIWGASGNSLGAFAGFVTPTLDVEQLDRKITDLKAVEGWLQTNASMLRATVQALEVQRNTIATLQSFSSMATQQASQMASAAAPSSGSGQTSAAPQTSSVPPGWPMPPTPAATTRAQPVPEPDVDDETDPDDDPDFESPPDIAPPDIASPESAPPESASPQVQPKARNTGKARATSGKPGAGAESLAQGAALAGQATSASIQNATAWWSMLQDQFAKVAHAAVAGGQTAPGSGKSAGTAAKRGKAVKPGADSAASLKKAGAQQTGARQAGAKMPAAKKPGAKTPTAKRAASKTTKAAAPARKAGARS